MNIAQKLIQFVESKAEQLTVKDVRMGLGYTCIELSDGSLGLAWTPLGFDPNTTCTHVKAAGTIAGSNAKEILQWLDSKNYLEKALGLAVFNAINSNLVEKKGEYSLDEAISLLNITEKDHVVMVGFFGSIIPNIKKIGCKFEIVELKTDKPGVITPEEGEKVLSKCSVAIITSTSVINGTCDGLLNSLKNPRAAVMLGPSTPLCTDVFKDTPITQLSGSIAQDKNKIKQIISEAGGTRLLKGNLKFVNLSC